MTTIKTNELTANKSFKSIVKENIKNISNIKKSYVAWIGYVTFLQDNSNNILGKFFRDTNGMTLYIN